ncbi:MAG TPA: PEGA domain-containing protein [Methylomirabilota bacterium]|nr:PEGA domain-containing protein [Methylomirabilota bacterium]
MKAETDVLRRRNRRRITPHPGLLATAAALLIGLLGSTTPVHGAEPPTTPTPLKAAVIVQNRAGAALQDKTAAFEDLLSSRVAGRGFTLLSRQVITDALKKTGEGANLDQQLSERSSALRLAQTMGADFILLASLVSYGSEKKSFNDGAVNTVNDIHTLRVAYRVADAAEGGALVGDTARVSKQFRATPESKVESSDVLNELLDEAALKLADSLPHKRAALTATAAKPKEVDVTIVCGVTDIVGQPLSVPDIRLGENGTVVRGTNQIDVQLLDVTVEVDGVVLGSAPGVFPLRPGFHKVRLSREGFSPWERTINAIPGQKLKVALQMSEAGYNRWKDSAATLQQLRAGEKLTDARVKVLEGFAQMLQQSGFKVDVQGKSLYDGAVIKQTVY